MTPILHTVEYDDGRRLDFTDRAAFAAWVFDHVENGSEWLGWTWTNHETGNVFRSEPNGEPVRVS